MQAIIIISVCQDACLWGEVCLIESLSPGYVRMPVLSGTSLLLLLLGNGDCSLTGQ